MQEARRGRVGLFTLEVVLLAPQVASQDMSLLIHLSRKLQLANPAFQRQQVIN